MGTLGPIMERFLSLVIFKIILVLFIIFKITLIVGNILVGNISGVLELLKVKKEK
jgi:hypothetical protein